MALMVFVPGSGHRVGLAATRCHASAIAGSNSVAHTRENAEAGRLVLADATLQAIEVLIPLGPAYA